jgi:predicted nucleotidyltransferase
MASIQDSFESIQAAVKALKRHGATEVFLFGSAASGILTDHSDVDLAVRGLPPRRFFEAMGEAQRHLKMDMDLVDLDEDTPFTRHLVSHGRLQRVG